MSAGKSTRAANLARPSPQSTKIDAQRRQLQRASALLACIQFAAEYNAGDGEQEVDVDFADAIRPVRDVIDGVVSALDGVALRRHGDEE